MPQYIVAWTEMIDADSPREAAKKAQAIFASHEPGTLEVQEHAEEAGPAVTINLDED
jgi:hypothetical protein